MDLEKDVFTTFEAAKICNANITSIKNWIDRGEIDAFRTPGGHYRIEREQLDSFLRRHEMPNPFQDAADRRILVIHRNQELVERLQGHFGKDYDYAWEGDVSSGLIRLGAWSPKLLILDGALEQLDPLAICKAIRQVEAFDALRVIVVHNRIYEAARLTAAGADAIVELDEAGDVEPLLRALETYIG